MTTSLQTLFCTVTPNRSTSISAALGMSVGKQLTNKRVNNCIAVIGDGAITGGMAFEALNNAGYLRSRMIVILNDNGQVSLPTGTHSAGGVVPAGALSSYTSRLLSSKPFQDFRSFAKGLNRLMPSEIQVRYGTGRGRSGGHQLTHTRLFDSPSLKKINDDDDQPTGHQRQARRVRARPDPGRDALRGAGLLLHRPRGRARSGQPHPHPRESPRLAQHQARAAPRQGT